MAMVIFVIFAILFLFGLPIVITLAVGKIINNINEKKNNKKDKDNKKE